MQIPFTKMQGIGNDFVVIDERAFAGAAAVVTPEFARKICDRRFGVGADQLLFLRPAHGKADIRMEILNADGTSAEMCGNGIRAVAVFMKARDPKARYRVETLAGILEVKVDGERVTVDMGEPALGGGFADGRGEMLHAATRDFQFYEVGMGNPHAVIFTPDPTDPTDLPLAIWGPAIERHSRFPKRTNVEFAKMEGRAAMRLRVWERGAGLTLACGTGACAAAVAAIATNRADGELEVRLPGGTLTIRWNGPGHPVMMEGPAREVFRGEYALLENRPPQNI